MEPARCVLTLVLCACALGGCSMMSSGMGGGELHSTGRPEFPVLFSWTSPDSGMSGSMVATLPSATFTGPFVQITGMTRREMLTPLWSGWDEGWTDWPYWSRSWPGRYDAVVFTRHYSGKVVANLRNDGGQHMRCRFHLDDPAAGMGGGGQGDCQLSGGRTIDAVFNRR